MSKHSLFSIMAVVSTLLMACSEKEKEITVQSVSISQSSAVLKIGESLELNVTVYPDNATLDRIEWSTSNQLVASVNDNGSVTANSYGQCRIEVSVSGFSDYCDITVLRPSIFFEWVGNSEFETVELARSQNAIVSIISARNIMFQDFKLILDLGNYNILADRYISISRNQSGDINPVMDLIWDSSSVAFIQNLGMTAGKTLLNRTEVRLDLKAILEAILIAQPLKNDTSFSIEIQVTNQSGYSASKTVKFHY